MTTRRALVLWPLSLVACGGGQPPGATTPDASSGTPITVNPSPSPTLPVVPTTDAWRPRYHYTPQRFWMNDPNGLVFFNGEYHLYYQYNPQGAQWGNISWGHAVSRDLVAWQELPVAIPATPQVMAFSGSVVVDHHNSAGFVPARPGRPWWPASPVSTR